MSTQKMIMVSYIKQRKKFLAPQGIVNNIYTIENVSLQIKKMIFYTYFVLMFIGMKLLIEHWIFTLFFCNAKPIFCFYIFFKFLIIFLSTYIFSQFLIILLLMNNYNLKTCYLQLNNNKNWLQNIIKDENKNKN